MNHRTRLLLGAAALISASPAARAADFQTILGYAGQAHLRQPNGPLAIDSAGAVFGAATYGGTRKSGERGAIFQLTPPVSGQTQWTAATLYTFGFAEGALPVSTAFLDNSGVLYGTTVGGGQGEGVIFTLTPPAQGQTAWTYASLFQFTTQDGLGPANLVMDAAGALYGANPFGNPNNNGQIFRLTPPAPGQTAWTKTVLHVFTSAEGRVPGPLLRNQATGTLYGILNDVGTDQNGAVFALIPPAAGQTSWHLKILHRFNGADGKYPNGTLLQDASGALYGTTANGGAHGYGTVFRLPPKAPLQTLHDFAGKDGVGPLSLTGNPATTLYGTTAAGGASYHTQQIGYGTVFSLTPPATGEAWTETILHNFLPRDGAQPNPITQTPSGTLSGVTQPAKQSARFGTVFAVVP
jgi:uncharacterized repeat protein (TIGR03803 family)